MKSTADLLLTGSIHLDVLTLFIFCATLSSYNLHRIVALKSTKPKENSVMKWSLENDGLIYFLFAISSIICLVSFFFLKFNTQLVLVFLGLLTIFYSLPSFFLRKNRKLREFPWIKIFLISIVWTSSTVILPVFEYHQSLILRNAVYGGIDHSIIYWIALQNFLFIFAITLPFDIRDADFDSAEKIKTIPNSIGISKSKILGYMIIIPLAILNYIMLAQLNFVRFHQENLDREFIFCSVGRGQGIKLSMFLIVCFLVYIFFLIKNSNKYKNDWFCLFWVDGCIILHFLIFSYSFYLRAL